MKLLAVIAALLSLVGLAGGDDVAKLVSQPPPAPDGLAWNRYETPNFEVLAINKADADKLNDSVEYMLRWEFDRWGFKQVNLPIKCKVIVCPDEATMTRLFNKGGQFMRIDRDSNGRVKAMTIWCWTDQRWHTSILPGLLTEVMLASFEQQYNVKFPLWLHRGMSTLNQGVPVIRQEVGSLSQIYAQNLPCFWTEDILTMTEDRLAKYQPANRQWYDRECAALCLYLVKTHGRKKFLDFLDASLRGPQGALQVIGQPSCAEFDKVFNRYMYNLSSDIVGNRTPNAYLTWDSR